MAIAIFATDKLYGFGLNNELPWKIPSELAHFKHMTNNSILIMGKNTWDSLPQKTITTNRTCIIVTHNLNTPIFNEHYVKSIQAALSIAFLYDKPCYIIGGKSILEQAFELEYVDRIVWSRIKYIYQCDVILNDLSKWLIDFVELSKTDCNEFEVLEYIKM
tara:strand:- start:5992 stop:6474 length:483 start_codon:yes stop_codon:yes gene_type:complete